MELPISTPQRSGIICRICLHKVSLKHNCLAMMQFKVVDFVAMPNKRRNIIKKFLKQYVIYNLLEFCIGNSVLVKAYNGSQQSLSGDSLVLTNMIGSIKKTLKAHNTRNASKKATF